MVLKLDRIDACRGVVRVTRSLARRRTLTSPLRVHHVVGVGLERAGDIHGTR